MSVVFALLGLGIAGFLMIRNANGERISQLVFLFSAVHALYVFPKVLALAVSSTLAAQYFQFNGVTYTVGYMALLSYLATIIAYKLMAPKSGVAYGIEDISLFKRRLTRFSIFIGGLGLLGFLGLMARSGGVQSYFFGLAFYQMELSGLNVWLIFVSRFIYPAIAAVALIATLRPSRASFLLLTLLCAFPLMNVIFLFRRSDLLILGFITIHVLAMSGRMQFNRVVMIAAIGLASVLITLFPYLRQDAISTVTGWDYGASNLTVQDRIVASLEVSEDDEITRAASTINNTYQSGSYQFGAFIWDSLINQFVPATIVGAEVKNALLLGRGSENFQVRSYFDEQSYFYVAPMGFAQAYEQFGPFGWIVFAALGAIIALSERKSWKMSNRVFLMVAIPMVCLAATNDIGSLPARLVTFWVLTRLLGSMKLKVISAKTRRLYRLARIFKISDVREAKQ